jgi:hypothetical protein
MPNINLFVQRRGDEANPQGEWMCDHFFSPQRKSALVLGILKHLGASKTTTTISLPGIGKSHLARDILAAGFSRVCLGDVDAGAVRYQQELLGDWIASGAASVFADDDVYANTGPSAGRTFDVVLDGSVTDVFIAQHGARRAAARMHERVRPNGGVLVAVSMFHRQWPGLLRACKYDSVAYAAIEQWSGNKRVRKHIRRDVAVWVARRGSRPTGTAGDALSGATPASASPPLPDEVDDPLLVQQHNGRKWIADPAPRDLRYKSSVDYLRSR